MTSTKHTRNMTKVFFVTLSILAALSMACVGGDNEVTFNDNGSIDGLTENLTDATDPIAELLEELRDNLRDTETQVINSVPPKSVDWSNVTPKTIGDKADEAAESFLDSLFSSDNDDNDDKYNFKSSYDPNFDKKKQ